jgi:hypothetical protein
VPLFTQSSFAATHIRSLCWRGDELVDWVGGGKTFTSAGGEQHASVSYSFDYRLDAATASPDGRFAVIYERLGTKGLLLRDGKILRELDRSFYHANAYEYPVTLFYDQGGRLVLAHCPRDYRHIELEDAETGRPLTASSQRKPSDFFHSRLAASPHGMRLLSAGWLWHPLSAVKWFDVARGFTDPLHLDDGDSLPHSRNVCLAEESSACWLDDDRIAVAASDETEDPEESRDACGLRLRPRGLAVYDLASRTYLGAIQLDEPAGTILALGTRYVLSLYRHPKVIDVSTGKVLHVWAELHSGRQDGSIIRGLKGDAVPPPMAFDPAHKRFAIAQGNAVTVIAFDHSALSSP